MRIFNLSELETNEENHSAGPGTLPMFEAVHGCKADVNHHGKVALTDSTEDGHSNPAGNTPVGMGPGQDDTDVPADIPDKADEVPADITEDLPGQYSPEVETILSEARARFNENLRQQALEERKRQIEAQQAEMLATLPDEVIRAAKNAKKYGTLSQALEAEAHKRWNSENREFMTEIQREYRKRHPERVKESNRKSQATYLERLRTYDPEKYREWVENTARLHREANARKKADREDEKAAEEEKKRLQAEEEEQKTEQDPAQEEE